MITAAVVLLSFLSTFAQSNRIDTRNGKIYLSSYEDVGLGHSRIIHNLEESFRIQLPKKNQDYLKAIYLEVSENVCEEGNLDCHYRIAARTVSPRRGSEENTEAFSYVKSLLPENFDPEVSNSMKKLLASNAIVEEIHPAIHRMDKDLQELRNSELVKQESHREVGLMAYSVGIESAKQWAEILNDPENPFNNMLDDECSGNRRLQFERLSTEDLTTNFLKVLQGDIVGAVDGALEGLLDPNKSPIERALEAASVASLKAFTESFVGNDDQDNNSTGICAVAPNLPNCDGVDPQCTLFPNRPACQNNDDEKSDDMNDYCPFPHLENCGLDLDDATSNDNGNSNTFCENFPNLCLSQGGGTPSNDDQDQDTGSPSNDDQNQDNNVGSGTFCENYPNLCLGQGTGSPNNDDEKSLCDKFPNNIFCQGNGDDGKISNVSGAGNLMYQNEKTP